MRTDQEPVIAPPADSKVAAENAVRLLEGRDILGDGANGASLSAEAENFLEKKILEILAKAKAQQGRASEPE